LHAASALALSTTAKILSLRPKLKHGAFQRAMPNAAWELTRAP